MTTDLVTWLLQQIDEDEEVARAAAGLGASRRRWMREAISCVVDTDNGLVVYGEGTPTPEQADHIARHDPARVLVDVDAMRRIVRLHRLDTVGAYDAYGHLLSADQCAVCLIDFPCPTLRWLALPYADYPGYREEWAP